MATTKICLAGLACCVLIGTASPQARRGTVRKPRSVDVDPRWFDASRIIVKFAEGTAVRLREGRLVTAGPSEAAVNKLLVGGARVERLFHESERSIDETRRKILAALPEGWDPPADLNNYYLWSAPTPAAGKATCEALNRLAVVEIAFPDHRVDLDADPDDIPPPTPLFEGRQTYFSPPPTGIDIRRTWRIPGGRGEKLQILDIETGLIIDHEDVPEAVLRNVIGRPLRETDHGLAVAGELVAERNGYGVTGGVYLSRYKFHSHQGRNWAPSVNTAAANSKPGDVIVLEVHLVHPVSRRFVPMEHRQDVFDAVRAATMRGIHVIAAAGNGSQNLDAAVYQRIFDRTFRDSGSVLVGATEGATPTRASFSNFGRSVDANGWGRNVTTSGYTNLFHPNRDKRQRYTSSFGGTSSATPIVTSAAAALISVAKQQLDRTLTPAQLRSLLRAHGTAVAGTIGPRPDLKKLLAAIGLPKGLDTKEKSQIGSSLQLDVSGPPGDFFALYVSAGPAELNTPIGRVLIDLRAALLATAGTLSGGRASYTTRVPNDMALLYEEFHWQALRFSPALTRIDLTSSVATFLER